MTGKTAVEGRIKISDAQMAITLMSAFTALGLYIYPRDLIEGAGQQMYLALLAATIAAAVPVLLLIRLHQWFPGQTPFQYAQVILGRPLGLLGGAWFALLYTGVAAVSLRQFGDLVNSVFLPRTPIEITMILLVTVAIYINWHGMEALIRFINLVYPFVIGLVGLVFLLAITRMTETQAIIPPLRFDLPAIYAGARRIMYEFVGIEAFAMLLPFVRRPRNPYSATLIPLLTNAVFLLLILVVTVGVFGMEPVVHLQYPGASVLRVLRFPGLLIERVGSFVALSWTLLGLMFLCVRFWTVPTGLAQMFGLPSTRFRYFLVPVGLMTFFLARWPGNPNELERFTHQVMVPLAMWTNTGLPLLLLLVAWIRGKGVRP